MLIILVLPEIKWLRVAGFRNGWVIVVHFIKEGLIFSIRGIKIWVVQITSGIGPVAVDGERLFVPVIKANVVALFVTLTEASEPCCGKYRGIWGFGI
jgi:hypothetical protein